MDQGDIVIERDAATSVGRIDMKLEVVVIPVSDVDRAKRFYASLGWRHDVDWPEWYAAYMAAEQAGTELPS